MRVIDNNSVEITFAYDEPTSDSDNTPAVSTDNPPLTDLAYTSLFYRIGEGAPVAAGINPATSPSGGAHITGPLLLPAPVNARTAIDFWVTSTDTAGNTQGEAHAPAFVIDRMAPLPPSNFTVA